MSDNEIIKALECCVSSKHICPHNCPMLKNKECLESLRRNALDLINRQKAEIENYKHLDVILHTAIDKLTTNIKAEAYKKFAERLKAVYADFDEKNEQIPYPSLLVAIDCLLIGMIGE